MSRNTLLPDGPIFKLDLWLRLLTQCEKSLKTA